MMNTLLSMGGLSQAAVLGLQGMGGIFLVMVLIALIVWALPKLSALFEKKDAANHNETNGSEDGQ